MNLFLLSRQGRKLASIKYLNINRCIISLRLSKLCIEELEKQLQESKTSLTNVLIEKENMKADLRKLEAKICFLEKNPLSQTPAEEPVTNVKTNVKPSLIAPAKLGASIASKKTTSIPTPSKQALDA